MKPTGFRTIDEYIALFPLEIREKCREIRSIIRTQAPAAVESISYGMPAYKLNGKPLVYFAAWKDHIGFYPTPSGIKAFANEISKYKTSKGAIQIPLTDPLPKALVQKIVRYRIEEVS